MQRKTNGPKIRRDLHKSHYGVWMDAYSRLVNFNPQRHIVIYITKTHVQLHTHANSNRTHGWKLRKDYLKVFIGIVEGKVQYLKIDNFHYRKHTTIRMKQPMR